MKEKNQFGKLIRYEREKAKLTVDELCVGLCSGSILRRVEAGQRKCEKILADALLQRIGVCSDKFIYVMNPEEQDWLVLREHLIDAVEMEDADTAKTLIEEYREMTKNGSKLHRQFLMLVEVILTWKTAGANINLLSTLQAAWKISIPAVKIEQIEERSLTINEFVIAMMYHRIQEDLQESEAAEAGYERLLQHLDKCADEEDR